MIQVYSLSDLAVVRSGGADTNVHTLQSLCRRPAACMLEHLHSNCYLNDNWPLARCEENLFECRPLFFLLLKRPSSFQAGLSDLCSCVCLSDRLWGWNLLSLFPSDWPWDRPLSSNLAISSSALFNTESSNSVGKSRGAWNKAARASCFRPDFTCTKWESLLQRVTLVMETKAKSDRCSMALATHCVILVLKFIKYWSSSVAAPTLPGDFTGLFALQILICACIPCWTLLRHLLSLAAWLHT